MSRPLRIEFPGAYYHVMNRGLAYQPIFKTDADHQTFLDLLDDVHDRWELQVYSFCLMSNHYHLCVQTPRVPLSRVMRHVDGVYTQRFNRRYSRDGPLFRGRYKAILIEGDRYLLAVARYIHQNPVEAKEVTRPEQYRWSSLKYYLAERGCPPWLDTQTLLNYFGGQGQAMLEFMRDQPEQEIVEFYRSARIAPILGSEKFKDRIRSQGTIRQMDCEIPERRHLAVDLEVYIRAVKQVCDVGEAEVVQLRRGVSNIARHLAMYVCREIGGYPHQEIARRLQAGSYSTISSACALMRKRLGQDRRLQELVKKIHEQLSNNYGHQAT